MDLVTIKAAYTSAKFAKEALTTVLDYKIDQKSKDKINEVLEKVGPIQDTIFELREELFKLQDENRDLKNSLREINRWEERINKLDLKKTSGGATVYVSNSETPYYVCPNCIEKKEIQPLQPYAAGYMGDFKCPGCDKSYPIGNDKLSLSP
ncbi:MAG TPA: hypothetical protein HPP95_12555 [Deltaproteobacteria bacterium]|nr:hypothetical protein [Deltaproteobacteria bacterium]